MAKKPVVKAKGKASKSVAKQAVSIKPAVKPVLPAVSKVVVEVKPAVEKAEKTVAVPIVKPLRMPVETAQPVRGVWSKLFGQTEVKKPDAGMREHLAAVKAGVMQELETLSAEKGVPLKASPFRTVVLPQMRRKRLPWMWPLLTGVVLVFAVVVIMVASKPADPAVLIGQALVAVQQGDVAVLERTVDMEAVAGNVVNQVFTAPQVDMDVLPPVLREQLQKDGGAGMDAMIKPGLAQTLKDDVLAAVKAGEVGMDGHNLLARLWQDLGGTNLKVGAPRVAMQDDNMVVAELPLHRMDLAVTLPLQVVMNKGKGGGWQVTDVPNFSAVMESFAAAAGKHAAVEPAAGGEVRIEVSRVRKAKGMDGSLVVGMALANKGNVTLRGLQLKVQFGDAAGQPMKAVVLTMDDELPAGQVRERVWNVPVDARNPVERYVRDLPLSALTVKVVPLVGGADRHVELPVPGEWAAL